ncbi:outer membrane beta-barrel protein [Pararhodonellum marinum]
MRIFLVACLLGLNLLVDLQAQTSIGIKGGVTNSSLSYRHSPGSPSARTGAVTQPTFSLVIEHFVAKNAGIQLEFQQITLGFVERDTLMRQNESRFEYLKIPILSNFYLGNRGRFHIKLGPHFGFLTNATDISREWESTFPPILPEYGTPEVAPKNMMYGLTAGVGISNLFGKSTLQAELRYSYEFGRQENLNRIFDMNFTNTELTISYLFQVLK